MIIINLYFVLHVVWFHPEHFRPSLSLFCFFFFGPKLYLSVTYWYTLLIDWFHCSRYFCYGLHGLIRNYYDACTIKLLWSNLDARIHVIGASITICLFMVIFCTQYSRRVRLFGFNYFADFTVNKRGRIFSCHR